MNVWINYDDEFKNTNPRYRIKGLEGEEEKVVAKA